MRDIWKFLTRYSMGRNKSIYHLGTSTEPRPFPHKENVLSEFYLEGLEKADNELKLLKNVLSDSEVRFRAIKNNLECIGVEKLHADFNCMHCLAAYGAKKIIESGFQPVEKKD